MRPARADQTRNRPRSRHRTTGRAIPDADEHAERIKLPPGPKGGLLLGSTFAYLRDQLGFLTAAVREYGDIVKLRLGNLTTYVLVNPEHIDYVLRSHADNFMKDKLTRWLIPLVGEGLLTSEGEFWRRQRRLAQPTFQRQQIERYAAVMVEHTERMLETWHDGQVRDPHEDMMHLTLVDRRQDAVRRRAGRRSRRRGRVARSRHEPLHEPDALVPVPRLSAAALVSAILAGDPADRRDHLRHHPARIARAARTRATCSRACWPRATSRGQAA